MLELCLDIITSVGLRHLFQANELKDFYPLLGRVVARLCSTKVLFLKTALPIKGSVRGNATYDN